MAIPRLGGQGGWFQQSRIMESRNKEAERDREFRKREAEKQFQRQLGMTIGGHIADVGSSFAKQAYQQYGQEQQAQQKAADRAAEMFGLSPGIDEYLGYQTDLRTLQPQAGGQRPPTLADRFAKAGIEPPSKVGHPPQQVSPLALAKAQQEAIARLGRRPVVSKIEDYDLSLIHI